MCILSLMCDTDSVVCAWQQVEVRPATGITAISDLCCARAPTPGRKGDNAGARADYDSASTWTTDKDSAPTRTSPRKQIRQIVADVSRRQACTSRPLAKRGRARHRRANPRAVDTRHECLAVIEAAMSANETQGERTTEERAAIANKSYALNVRNIVQENAWYTSKKAGATQDPEPSIRERTTIIFVKKIGNTSPVLQKAAHLITSTKLLVEVLNDLLVLNAETQARQLPSGCNAEQMRERVRLAHYAKQRGMREEGAENDGDGREGELVMDDEEMPVDFTSIQLEIFFKFGPGIIGGLGYEM